MIIWADGCGIAKAQRPHHLTESGFAAAFDTHGIAPVRATGLPLDRPGRFDGWSPSGAG